jgi:hypothetical protein
VDLAEHLLRRAADAAEAIGDRLRAIDRGPEQSANQTAPLATGIGYPPSPGTASTTSYHDQGPPLIEHYHARMDDDQIHERIEKLVNEEHKLWEREAAGHGTDEDRRRAEAVKVSLDQSWVCRLYTYPSPRDS